MSSARLRLHAGATGAWNPYLLGPSRLKEYFVAADNAAGAVTTWTGRIAKLAPTQGTAGLRPVASATSFNSAYPGVTFDGSDDFLRTTTNVNLLPTGATAGSIFILGQYLASASVTGNKYAIAYGAGAGTSRGIFRINSGSVNKSAVSDGATNLLDTSTDISTPFMLRGRWAGTTEYGWVNTAPYSTPSATISSLNTGTTALTLGANQSAVTPGNFLLCEAIITTDIADADANLIYGYWAWTYNLTSILPATFPYKYQRP